MGRHTMVAIAVMMTLGACKATDPLKKLCDKTGDESARYGARETLAREGVYVKCVERGAGWNEYRLTGPGTR